MPRPSPVRDAVQDRVLGGDRHDWGIDDLLADLREAGVAADYSSVFRAVSWLEERGVAQRVDLGDGKARYEAAAARHHDHVRCERCGSVAEAGCIIGDAVSQVEAQTGYRLTAHSLVLSGLCPSCQAG
jgi:Fe2+ or Zn2+ uptake regulation protein